VGIATCGPSLAGGSVCTTWNPVVETLRMRNVAGSLPSVVGSTKTSGVVVKGLRKVTVVQLGTVNVSFTVTVPISISNARAWPASAQASSGHNHLSL